MNFILLVIFIRSNLNLSIFSLDNSRSSLQKIIPSTIYYDSHYFNRIRKIFLYFLNFLFPHIFNISHLKKKEICLGDITNVETKVDLKL